MAQQGVFTLPAGISFGVTVLVNSSAAQQVTVLVDGAQVGVFNGVGTTDKNLGTQLFNSGRGAVQIQVAANGKASDLVSAQLVLTDKLNVAVVGSEDSTDNDYNDAIALLNWPLG